MDRTAETIAEDATCAFIDAAEREAQRLAKLKARTKAKVAAKAAAWAAAERAAEMAELAKTTGQISHPKEDDECGLLLEDNNDNDGIILLEENDADMPSLEENDDDMPSLEENATPVNSNDSSSVARRRLNILQSPPCQFQPPPVPQSPKLSAAFGSAHGLGSGLLGLAASPSCSTACGMSLMSCSSAPSASNSPASVSASPTPAVGFGLAAHSPRANRKNLFGGAAACNANDASGCGTTSGAQPGRSPRANCKNAYGTQQAQQQQQGTQRSTPPGTPQITPPAQRRGGARNGNKQPAQN